MTVLQGQAPHGRSGHRCGPHPQPRSNGIQLRCMAASMAISCPSSTVPLPRCWLFGGRASRPHLAREHLAAGIGLGAGCVHA
jgi:hypothetical protein